MACNSDNFDNKNVRTRTPRSQLKKNRKEIKGTMARNVPNTSTMQRSIVSKAHADWFPNTVRSNTCEWFLCPPPLSYTWMAAIDNIRCPQGFRGCRRQYSEATITTARYQGWTWNWEKWKELILVLLNWNSTWKPFQWKTAWKNVFVEINAG